MSRRKVAEDALRQQQGLLRIAGRMARLGGWALDLAAGKVAWSDEICAIHEVPAGYEPALDQALDFYAPEYRDEVARVVGECAANGTPFDFEFVLITAKGRRIWVRSTGEAVRDESGNIVGLQGAFQDIGDRKQAESEQRKLTERLATTLESITDGFFTLDHEYRFTYVNAEAERMFVRQRDDLIGVTMWEAFPETLGTAFERAYLRATAEQVTVDFQEYFAPLAKWFGVRTYPSEQGLTVYFRDVTSSREAELALRASEARFRAVIQSSWDVFQLVDPDGRITYESSAVTRVLGYQPEEMIGHNIVEFVHPDDLIEIMRTLPEHLAASGNQRTVVLRIRHKDGSWRWVESFEVNLLDHPDVRAIAVNYRDITDRQLAEEAVRLRDRAIEQVSQGIIITDPNLPDNPVVYASSGMERITGYRVDEILGTNCRMFQGRDTDPGSVQKLRAAVADGRSCSVELLNYRKDGTPFWNDLSVNPVRDAKGEVSVFVGVQIDVTERKKLQAERDSLLDRLQMQIDRMPFGYLLSDASFAYTQWNETAERIFGFPESEVLGKHPFDVIVPPASRPMVATIFERVKAGSMDANGECENVTRDGRTIICEWHNTPMFDASGVFVGMMSLANDITDRKGLELQLLQAQKMEAVGRLAGGVAHDFNNLLTVISGSTELVLMSPDVDPEVRESLTAIRDAGERAASLTRQLLSFSRQTMLQPRVLDLNDVVSRTAGMLRRLIGEDIEFTTVLAPQLRRVKVDPGQLDQVLMNLAVNARDAMPRGGKLTVETRNVTLTEEYAALHLDATAGEHVMLAMSDTGQGMTPDVMHRIFDPFFTTKGVGRGTGLGLAMVFGIVQQSGGSIHVYSEPGRGSSFKIYLPVVSEALAVNVVTEPAASLRGTETILLVEDEDQVRALTVKSLTRQGYRVLTASDGREALDIARSHVGPLDLILTDVVMPNLGGPAMVKQLADAIPGIKVLFMSGYTDDAVIRHGLIEADMAFIQKPFTPMGLARKVREVLDAKGQSTG